MVEKRPDEATSKEAEAGHDDGPDDHEDRMAESDDAVELSSRRVRDEQADEGTAHGEQPLQPTPRPDRKAVAVDGGPRGGHSNGLDHDRGCGQDRLGCGVGNRRRLDRRGGHGDLLTDLRAVDGVDQGVSHAIDVTELLLLLLKGRSLVLGPLDGSGRGQRDVALVAATTVNLLGDRLTAGLHGADDMANHSLEVIDTFDVFGSHFDFLSPCWEDW